MADRRLGRVLRVRTLQLTMAQAEEARATQRIADEQALRNRILQLAADVAPTPSATPSRAASLGAAALYRDRLHQSVGLADRRVAAADQGLLNARTAREGARRDQNAVEKLIAKAETAQVLRELRALEDAPPIRKRNRHDPC